MSLGAREEDKERIVESLNTIVQALMGHVVEAIRTSVDDLGAETGRRIDSLREETKTGLDTLRTEMLAEDQNVKREAMTSVETRTNFVLDQTQSKLETARRDLDQKLTEVDDRLQKDHLAISERLDGMERGLTGHTATTGRIKDVLDSLGNVLSQEKPPHEAATDSPSATPASIGDANTDHDGVPSGVEVTLDDSSKPSVIETQPVPVGAANPGVNQEVEGALDRVDLHAGSSQTPRSSE